MSIDHPRGRAHAFGEEEAMSINFIPNDPLAGASAPGILSKTKRPNRPASRASFTFKNPSAEGKFDPGTPGFLFWQCREAGLAALQAWETFAGQLAKWQGNRKKLPLLQDVGVDVNAFYDRASFSFFHRAIGPKTFFSGASTDVVSHEVGHGLLDSVRPQLWDAPFLEAGAFHEAFGDCVAILTALHDLDTRKALLAATTTLRKRNFVESTAEELSDGIRRLLPTHNAAEPRHAFNTFQFQIPETLPDDGGPGELIDEVHSFGMVFTGCFYDLIALIFADQPAKTEAALLASARTAGALLVEGAKTALITPRFFQAVGRAMVLADEQSHAGANRDRIRIAFQKHSIMLGANAMLAPAATLAGAAPHLGRVAAIGPATRKDLAARLGAPRGARLSVEHAAVSGQSFARVLHTQTVSLGALDNRLKGVTIAAEVPVMVGESGGRAAVMGHMPEPVSTEREVNAFVGSLLSHGQIEFGGGARGPRRAVGAVAGRPAPVSRETHRVTTVGGKKLLSRVRFHCRTAAGRRA
jgi:Fungalysin metallopeptidase (M36)